MATEAQKEGKAAAKPDKEIVEARAPKARVTTKHIEDVLETLDALIADLGQDVSDAVTSEHAPSRAASGDLKASLSALETARSVIAGYSPGLSVTTGVVS